jgi:gamma-glutamyltranspeptidase / glutathione hydrolase
MVTFLGLMHLGVRFSAACVSEKRKRRLIMSELFRSCLRNFTHSVALLAFVALSAPTWADHPQSTPGVPPKAEQKGFRNGVVAVSHPLGADAGAAMLEEGGNAIDAAAAVMFALNVVEPQSAGIGGGGFMMIHLAKSNKTFIIDSREKAPATATADMFAGMDFTQASTSGISVGVPGALRGISLALSRWGTMTLAQVMKPAIELAEDGFRINPVLAADIVDSGRGVVMTTLQPETAAIFQPGGIPLKAGDLLVQRDLAKTFRLIAEQGPDVFYKGQIAQAIAAAQMRTRFGTAGVGRMSLQDLANYEPKLRQPIVGDYRGFTLQSMSPPSSGGLTIIQTLKMIERFPLGDSSQGFGFGAKNTLHVMIEALRLAYADRAFWMGDEDFVHVPKLGLLADPYVQSRSALIDLNSVMANPSAGNPLPFDTASLSQRKLKLALGPTQKEGIHTTHWAVVDKHGNIVTYTNTIESLFGSGITVPGYGFLLNNELTDFNMTPTFNAATGNPGANDVAPGKRPRSSMSPTMLFKNGKPFAAYGSPGGATIINSVFQITLNLLDHGMTIQEAIDSPRITVSSPVGTVQCEVGALVPLGFTPTPQFSPAVLQALRNLGHDIPPCTDAPIGSVQAVIIDLQTGKQYGGADPRRQGTVVGLPPRHHDKGDGDSD